MECGYCGKAIKPPGSLRQSAHALLDLLSLFAGDTYTSRPKASRTERGPLRADLEDGDVWYCSEECKSRDLWECDHCHSQFSRGRTTPIDAGPRPSARLLAVPAEEPSVYLICPDCSRRLEEAIAAIEQVYQGLIATIYSEYEACLRAECDESPPDAAKHLQLADWYLERWDEWRLRLSESRNGGRFFSAESSLEPYHSLITRSYVELSSDRFHQFAQDLSYHRASLIASELVSEAFSNAVALGLGAFDEGRAHYWIAQTLRWKRLEPTSPLQASVKALKRSLRRDPHNLEAVQLLRSAYVDLDKTDQLYDIDIALRRAEALAVPDSSTRVGAGEGESVATADVSGAAFEERCFHLLRRMGFVATATSPTKDGGIDIVATHSQPIIAGTYLIECKDWKGDVGVAVVRELYGVVSAEGANKGILIASSGFTRAAREFAQGKRIELIDGKALDDLMREYSASESAS